MTMIHDAYVNAVLADAAYVDGLDGRTQKGLIAQLTGRMTAELAKYIGTNFMVLTQIGDLDSGFDATVWKETASGNVYVSMRGTLGARDLLEDAVLATSGLAYSHLADMVNWWLRVTTTGLAPQIAVQNTAVPDDGSSGAITDFVAAPSVLGTGELKLAGVSAIKSVNGHSLGGYLATAFARLFGAGWPIERVNTFNSAGFRIVAASDIEIGFNQIAQAVGPALGLGAFSALQNNYFASNGINVTTNTWDPIGFTQYGERVGIFQEDGVFGTTNHYMYKLTDVLALGDVLAQWDPSLDIAKLSSLVSASTTQMPASYESLLDSFRRLLLGRSVTPTPVGDDEGGNVGPQPESRIQYQKNLSALRAAIAAAPGQVTISDLSGRSVSELMTRTQAANGLAYRYALKELNPFAVLGPDSLYDDDISEAIPSHNVVGELNLYVDATSTPAGMTTRYIEDRSKFLYWRILANTVDATTQADAAASANWQYVDRPQAFSVYVAGGGASPSAPARVAMFGGDGSDALVGGLVDDRLYGGMGADFLAGGAGDDYLEGGAGIDVYQYSAGKSLLGDLSNDGADEILDTDGKGLIRYTYTETGLFSNTVRDGVIGGVGIRSSDTTWQSPDSNFSYAQHFDGALGITVNGDAGGSIRILGFNFGEAALDGYLGIQLVDQPMAPATALDILGDREIKDYTVVVQAEPGGGFPEDYVYPPEWLDVGHEVKDLIEVGTDPDTGEPIYEVATYTVTYHLNDALGNVERTAEEHPDFSDVFFDSALNDRIVTGGNDDLVYGTRGGNDRIDAGAGRDWVRAGDGADWVEGGANGTSHFGGGDILEGGAGNDTLFGDTAKPIAQAIADGELGGSNTDRGEYINGGAGNDILVGGDKTDVLFGAGGADLLIGGAGDDFLNGDFDYLLLEASVFDKPFEWQVQYAIDGASRQDFYIGFAGSEAPDPGADVIYGGAGNDVANGGGGNDYIDLGTGDD
jgi:Ca2+-binding RTX toxin-like protein